MNIEPICDNILAKLVPLEEVSKGGIIIPTLAQARPSTAEVLAVGPGRLMSSGDIKPLSIKAGDKVLLAKFGGREIEIEGVIYLFLKEEEILAILKEKVQEPS